MGSAKLESATIASMKGDPCFVPFGLYCYPAAGGLTSTLESRILKIESNFEFQDLITAAKEWGNRTLVDHERFDVQ